MEVRNLVVSYPGRGLLAPEVRAVDGISLTVPHGHALGIVGESGSGKSTLAKTLVGLARPKSGTIHYREEVIHPERMSAQQRSDIQYIFQDAFGALNPRMNVEQAIGEPLSIHGAHRGAGRRDVVRGLLEEVGLAADHLDRFPRELSGGQRQRVTIARALALEPKVLICDEIVSALDVSVQAQILNLLKDLQEFRGLSLIFISHDLPVVAHMCSDIAVMKSGKIVEHGRADAILTSPDHSYTRALLRAAERLEAPCPDRLRSLTAA